MATNKIIASDALVHALRLRKRIGATLRDSVSPYAAAEQLGIEVRFMDFPSMEGMYVAGASPKILLSSLRPQGRRAFTCAHEIGHHVFGHGEQFDELISQKSAMRRKDIKEFAADSFASFFLMPKSVIDNGMTARGYKYRTLKPTEVFRAASWLGVGYSTLVNHMLYTLSLIDNEKSEELLQVQPREIKTQLLGVSINTELHIVDHHWLGRPIDCQVNDYVLLPKNVVIERPELFSIVEHEKGILLKAEKSGLARAELREKNWASFLRVSPSQYTGRSCYRFEEEVDE